MRSSINRTTVIIILAIFLTISVGYALFSDTITIEGTATTQSNFDIQTTCITNITTDMLYDFGFEDDLKEGTTVAEMYKEYGYKDISCSVSDDKVTYSAGFDYSGANKFYAIKMENISGVPSVLNIENIEELINTVTSNVIKKYDMDDNLIETINNRDLSDWQDKAFFAVANIIIEDSNGNFYSIISTGLEDFYVDGSKPKLEPGEALYILILSRWPDEEIFKESNVKYVATSSYTMDWQQYTN